MNIALLLDLAADGFGDRVAIGSRHDGVRFSTLRDHARTIAARAADESAHTLALLEPNGPLVAATLFGAAWAGHTYVPINFRLPEHARVDLLHRLRPVEVVTPDWLDRPAAAEPYSDAPGRPAVLLFTSGSSAEPKAAVLEHDQLLAYQFNTVEYGAADDDEALLLVVPPFHVAGVTALLSSTYAARRVVPLPHFTAPSWLETARAEAITHAFLVPTMLARIVAAMDADPTARVPTLRSLAYGGARLPQPVLERALELFPDTDFVNAYGLTETSSTVAVLGPADHREAVASTDPEIRRRLGSAGLPVPGIELRVVDEFGAPVGPDRPGVIEVRGAQVSGEYLGRGTEHGAGEPGWWPTGDRGRIDTSGYVYVEGRGDETIIRGGENLATAEIEDALLRHPAVAAAAVVGLPDPEWGARVAAMVALHPGAETTADALRTHVHDRLGSLKTPEIVEFRPELPHTPTGKVLRRQVIAELTEPTAPH